RSLAFDPLENLRLSGADAVHVPGGDLEHYESIERGTPMFNEIGFGIRAVLKRKFTTTARRTEGFSLARKEIPPSCASRLRGKFLVLPKTVFPRANRSSEMLCRGDFRARRRTVRAGLRLRHAAGLAHSRLSRYRP